ncbi:SIR2 family protein [Catenovulum agarivorans]|uniref:SIR2 family protein n=1 Tax=Catenovulum agarivorans TaxID=1172192 RepID=UPI0004B95B5F|nr:SIR2 family protein [Catenovulum agarivorans]
MSSAKKHQFPKSILAHLNKIAERLYAGRASVLVGSGFSRNASNNFPLWGELGDRLYEQAHGCEPNEDAKRYSSLLRIAEEAEATIGRPALDDLLRKLIPDESVEPSELHSKLLELPWVDVFTTNYDTLLERATDNVTKRKYTPVHNKLDLASACSPRIVKLHGSFPSQRPFILTEEDYRTYPEKFAPFVNTVRQSFMENTICLIGFSGDDPNFLQWIGWLRDQLESQNTQKIYLIGVFNLTSARQSMLAKQNINIVNIGLCSGEDYKDHGLALNKVIEYLNDQNVYHLDWPHSDSMTFPEHQKMNPTDSPQEFKKLLSVWQEARKNYPGWLILPNANRETLWFQTNHWVQFFESKEGDSNYFTDDELDILLMAELLWRLDRCLVPLISDLLANTCEELLKKYEPFEQKVSKASTNGRPNNIHNRGFNWKLIQKAWLEVFLSLFRFYREDGKLEEWEKLNAQTNVFFAFLSEEQKQFVYYERYLFAVFTFDIKKVHEAIKSWQSAPTLPYWQSKRIMALAECGVLDDADKKAKLALAATRKKAISDINGLSCLYASHEAYQILIYRSLRDINHDSFRDPSPETPEERNQIKELFVTQRQNSRDSVSAIGASTIKYEHEPVALNPEDDWEDLLANKEKGNSRCEEWRRLLTEVRQNNKNLENKILRERWDELLDKRVDPWGEIKLFEFKLSISVDSPSTNTIKPSFDIGRQTSSSHHNNGYGSLVKATSILRFSEEIGLPFAVKNWHLNTKKSAENSLKFIQKDLPFWTIATLVRTGELKVVDNLFSREFIFAFPTGEIDLLINQCIQALNDSAAELSLLVDYSQSNLASRLAKILPEVVSRLCCKASYNTRIEVLDFVVKTYKSSHKRRYMNFGHLVRRLIESFTDIEQYQLIPKLLEIDFPEDINPRTEDDFFNPFLRLNIKK